VPLPVYVSAGLAVELTVVLALSAIIIALKSAATILLRLALFAHAKFISAHFGIALRLTKVIALLSPVVKTFTFASTVSIICSVYEFPPFDIMFQLPVGLADPVGPAGDILE